LRELCIKGLLERYEGNEKRLIDGKLNEEVMARLDRELGVIEKLGFPTYFLIVWDFVNHAREQRHLGDGQRQRRRGDCLLCALPVSRLSAGIRLAVRAILG
jgi:hypothetical protein